MIEFCPAIELVKDKQGKVCGAVLMNLETEHCYYARLKWLSFSLAAAAGYITRAFLLPITMVATADGIAMAYRLGAKLAFLDTMQYHPTVQHTQKQILGLLVTEKVRGLGAQPVNIKGEQLFTIGARAM